MTTDLSWLPDWHNESEYPAPEDLSFRLWAWEFLRRNPAYQKACDELGLGYFKEQRTSFFRKLGISKEQYIKSLHDPESQEEVILWLSHFHNQKPEKPPEDQIHYLSTVSNWYDKFGLKIPDHYCEADPITLFALEFEVPQSKNSPPQDMSSPVPDDLSIEIKYKKHQAIITIDLLADLEPQINSIKKRLTKIPDLLSSPKELAKNREIQHYPIYIRTLDAIAGGVDKPKDIASVYWPGKENDGNNWYKLSDQVKTARKAAIKLQDGGYATLPTFIPILR